MPKITNDLARALYFGVGSALVVSATQQNNLTLAAGLAASGIFLDGLALAPALKQMSKQSRYSSSFNYATEFTDWTSKALPSGGRDIRFKERPSREFVYWWPGLLPEPVPERVFDDFVTRGYDREKSARNGGRYDRNEAWSANYFCRKRRPAMPWATYQSCMIVLCFTRHHTGKWRTSPGNLVHYHLTVYRLLEAIKEEWLYRQETYQQRQRPGVWRRVAGVLK